MARPPGTPREPLQECSPNTRSRVVSARDHGIKWPVIARMEKLYPKTCQTIVARAPLQTSCITRPRSGRPPEMNDYHHRRIWRALAINPKITPTQLIRECNLLVKKQLVYRYLKKLGI